MAGSKKAVLLHVFSRRSGHLPAHMIEAFGMPDCTRAMVGEGPRLSGVAMQREYVVGLERILPSCRALGTPGVQAFENATGGGPNRDRGDSSSLSQNSRDSTDRVGMFQNACVVCSSHHFQIFIFHCDTTSFASHASLCPPPCGGVWPSRARREDNRTSLSAAAEPSRPILRLPALGLVMQRSGKTLGNRRGILLQILELHLGGL